jgi:hypothetical protein
VSGLCDATVCWWSCVIDTTLKSLQLKYSGKWKTRGIGRLANVRRWFRIVAIDVCLFFNFVIVFSLIGDSPVIGMIIGEAHRTARSASSFLLFFFGPPIGAINNGSGYIGSPFLLAQGASDRQYYWRRGHRFANTIRAGGIGSPILCIGARCIGSPILLAEGASVR